MNLGQVETSTAVLGAPTVDMLLKVHDDALWMLENIGVGCRQADILDAFRPYEADGRAIVYENRVYITALIWPRPALPKCPGSNNSLCPATASLWEEQHPMSMMTTPVPAACCRLWSMSSKLPGLQRPTPLWPAWDVVSNSRMKSPRSMLMVEHCSKPLYYVVTSERSLEKAKAVYRRARQRDDRILPHPASPGSQREFLGKLCSGGPGRAYRYLSRLCPWQVSVRRIVITASLL
jgi:hypothetical protein